MTCERCENERESVRETEFGRLCAVCLDHREEWEGIR